MDLKKAKELLQQDLDDPGSLDLFDLIKAQKLGIEALKAWERIRIGATSQHLWLLPSETED